MPQSKELLEKLNEMKESILSFSTKKMFLTYNLEHEIILTIDYSKIEQTLRDLRYTLISNKPYMVIMNAHVPYYPKGLNLEFHYHNYYETMTMLTGECFFDFLDGTTVHLKQGETIIIPPKKAHSFRSKVECLIQIIVSV